MKDKDALLSFDEQPALFFHTLLCSEGLWISERFPDALSIKPLRI